MKNLFYLAGASLFLCCVSCKEGTKDSDSSSDTTVQNEVAVDTIFRTRFVLDDQYIILEANPDTNQATGAATLSSNGAHHIYSATKDINQELMPQSYLRLLNTDVQVVNNNGKLVPAKIKSFKLYSGYTPHSGEVQTWDGTMADDRRPYTTEEKTKDIWNNGTRYLVAMLEITKPTEEEEFVIAVPLANQAAILPQTDDDGEALKKQIFPVLVKTVDYDTSTKAYHKITGATGNWWEGEEGRENVRNFKSQNGTMYTLVSHAGGDPCGGDYYFEKFSIWKSVGNAAPQLLYITNGDFEIMSVTDIDHDNNPEFVIDNRAGVRILVSKQGNTWVKQYTREVPNLDCGC